MRCDSCEGRGGFGASDVEYTRCNACKGTGTMLCDLCRSPDSPATVVDRDGAWCDGCERAGQEDEKREQLRRVLKINCGTHPVVPR